jgi:hypothetical protein
MKEEKNQTKPNQNQTKPKQKTPQSVSSSNGMQFQ